MGVFLGVSHAPAPWEVAPSCPNFGGSFMFPFDAELPNLIIVTYKEGSF